LKEEARDNTGQIMQELMALTKKKWSFLKRGYPETIQNRSFSSLLFKYMDAHIFGNPQNAFANKV